MNKQREHLNDLLAEFRQGMLVTKEPLGTLHARPMYVADREDGQIWFLTDRDSAKMDELQKDTRVAVTFQDSSRFVALQGVADVLMDRATIDKLWNPAFNVWFPKGKDDPNLVALRVIPLDAEYWDNSGVMNKLRFAKQAVEALLKDRTPNVQTPEQHGQVSM